MRKRQRILLIQADADLAAAARARLAEAGFTVLLALDAEVGVRMSATSLPDVVVIEFNPPYLEGLAALRKLRAEDCTRQVPVIAWCLRSEDTREAMRWGANGHVRAPFQIVQLEAAIQRVLYRSSQGRDDRHATTRRDQSHRDAPLPRASTISAKVAEPYEHALGAWV